MVDIPLVAFPAALVWVIANMTGCKLLLRLIDWEPGVGELLSIFRSLSPPPIADTGQRLLYSRIAVDISPGHSIASFALLV